MKQALTFDDVLIIPKFSTIKSRKDVDLSTDLNGLKLTLPIISANMDTITSHVMADAMAEAGGIGCLHRFEPVENSPDSFSACKNNVIVSFGVGEEEKRRVTGLVYRGATHFCLDVAHGSQKQVVEMTKWFKEYYPAKWLMVGNFASLESIICFLKEAKVESALRNFNNYNPLPNAIKVGIGSGSVCKTRVQTGIGYPQFSAIQEIKKGLTDKIKIVSDGGHRTPGDVCKALAAGADAVMLGGMLAGTTETPGKLEGNTFSSNPNDYKKVYRGSASMESYIDQNKAAEWRSAEGEAIFVSWKGPVKNILQEIEGSLRSSFTYVGASTLKEFQEKAEFVQITNAGIKENGVHGKV